MKKMDIIHIAAEMAPIAKVGGLGDVLLGLGRALTEKHKHVEIILPKYDCLDYDQISPLEVVMHDLSSYFENAPVHNTIWRGHIDQIQLTFIETHDPYGFFERGTVYGCPDDIERFTYFSKVALEYLVKSNKNPEIIHIHDWHTSLTPILLKEMFSALSKAKTVLTIHNLAYQGISNRESLEKIGLSKDILDRYNLHDPQQTHLYNLMRGGIENADAVTTVSPNYAKEVLTPMGGGNLYRCLNDNSHKFQGILNGIDCEYWNPKEDPFLPFHYNHHDIHASSHPFIPPKGKIQKHLRHLLSLAEEECPIVSCITRLVPQKGPELIKQGILKTLEKGGQFILLGSTSDPQTHEVFYNLKRKFAESRQVHIELTYNEPLSHLVYAASDLFLVPSIFEPCGLSQLIAMHYGTVPLVRRTGGLADTVFEGFNGFVFEEPTAEGIQSAMDRAFVMWKEDSSQWRKLIEAGMKMDVSWKKPMEEYLHLYKHLQTHKIHV